MLVFKKTYIVPGLIMAITICLVMSLIGIKNNIKSLGDNVTGLETMLLEYNFDQEDAWSNGVMVQQSFPASCLEQHIYTNK